MQFTVTGMTCSHCVRGVTRALQALDPQAQVEVDLGSGRVVVDGAISEDQARAAIEAEGDGIAGDAPGCCGSCSSPH